MEKHRLSKEESIGRKIRMLQYVAVDSLTELVPGQRLLIVKDNGPGSAFLEDSKLYLCCTYAFAQILVRSGRAVLLRQRPKGNGA